MKRWLSYLIAIAMFAACGLGSAAAQNESRRGTVIVPPTNVVPQQYRGRRAHTNFLIFVPAAKSKKRPAAISGPSGETPSSLACVYQTGPTPQSGCPISYTSNYDNPSGGSKMIAIVDAYDYPSALSDFNAFSQKFGLPSGSSCGNGSEPCFQKTWPNTISQPQSNCGWAQEEALDIEWSHAMAPHAQIVLVEAASTSYSDLMTAVQYAANLVAGAGGGEVSMSWSGSESSTESTWDSYFTSTGGVSYFASSGDTGGKVGWPSTSPDVISAGGTHLVRDSNGNFTGETVWSDAGGGPSKVEPVPNYQSSITPLATLLNGYRGTPDISFDADPYTGVSVYDTTSCQGMSGWMVFGGTSVSSPSLAGIFNLAGAFGGGWDSGTNSSDIQSQLYQNYSSASNGDALSPYLSNFFDVTSGSAGSYSAGNDWDYASGIGTLRGLAGITGSTSSVVVSSVSLSSSSVTGGNQLTGNTVTLSGPAPSGGATISFTSSDPTVVPAPADVTVSANNTSTTFTVDTSAVSSSTNVTITASYNNTSANATLTVNPATSSVTVSSLSLNPSSVTGGTPSTGTVTLSAAPTSDVTVTLASSNSSVASVPTSVTVAAGSTSNTFTVSTSAVSTSTSVTITASYNSSSANATLTVNPATASFSLSATPGNVTLHKGGTANYTITVTPSGGFDQTVSFQVSGAPSGATISLPPVTGSGSTTLSVTVPSGTKGNYTLLITGSTTSGLSQSVSVGLKTR